MRSLFYLEGEQDFAPKTQQEAVDDNEVANSSTTMQPESLKSLLESYQTTVTSFGLKRINSGRPLEKVFWAVGVMVIMSFTCYTLYKNSVLEIFGI